MKHVTQTLSPKETCISAQRVKTNASCGRQGPALGDLPLHRARPPTTDSHGGHRRPGCPPWWVRWTRGAQAALALMVVPGPMSCSRDISGGLLGSPSSSELMPGSSPRLAGRPPGGGGGPIFTLHCIFNWIGIKNIWLLFSSATLSTNPPTPIHSFGRCFSAWPRFWEVHLPAWQTGPSAASSAVTLKTSRYHADESQSSCNYRACLGKVVMCTPLYFKTYQVNQAGT